MFFKLHKEGKIAYKQLTDADLGRTGGHTTHIGLFGSVLTFLPNNDFDDEALFLYNKTSQNVPYYFDRIIRQNGDINSPKIKKGGKNVVSVTTLIQDIANENIDYKRWFLLWFGLESEKVVFYLFSSNSDDFIELSKIIDLHSNLIKKQINNGDVDYNSLLNALVKYVNSNTSQILQELEVQSQIGNTTSAIKKYKPFDVLKANKLFLDTGRKGEEIIAKYFEHQKSRKQISNYSWYNEINETGLPYDFHLQTNDQKIIYIDVKSTTYKFHQPLIFSDKEIRYITDTPNYSIYRVYDLSEEIEMPKLKICNDSRTLAQNIHSKINVFKDSLEEENLEHQLTKIAVNPLHTSISFDKEIYLKHNY